MSCRPFLRSVCAARSGLVFFDSRYECSLSTADLVVFCWVWPLFCCWFCVFCSWTKRKSGWGICGSSVVVWVCLFLVDSAFRGLLHVHGHTAMYFSCFYHFYFCQDRASGNIGRTGGKKKKKMAEGMKKKYSKRRQWDQEVAAKWKDWLPAIEAEVHSWW